MSELRRLKGLLPPELQSWVTVEGTTEVNPPLIRCEEIGNDQVNPDRLGEMGSAGDGSAQSVLARSRPNSERHHPKDGWRWQRWRLVWAVL